MKDPIIDLSLSYSQIVILTRCLENAIETRTEQYRKVSQVVEKGKLKYYEEKKDADILFMRKIMSTLTRATL